jgi:dihydrofolate reductase
MRRIKYFVAASLDGYIARSDGGVDWLSIEPLPAGEDYGYQAFMDSVDVLVMGRHTFDQVLTFGDWPYGDKPVVVLTSRELTLPDHLIGTVSTLSLEPPQLISHLGEGGARHLYVDGGITIQRFLRAGLVDQLIITRIPILLGDGIPLFGPLDADINITHVTTQVYANGLVQSTYQVRPT